MTRGWRRLVPDAYFTSCVRHARGQLVRLCATTRGDATAIETRVHTTIRVQGRTAFTRGHTWPRMVSLTSDTCMHFEHCKALNGGLWEHTNQQRARPLADVHRLTLHEFDICMIFPVSNSS